MTATYDCIATTTLGSAQTAVEFASISGSYTDLILVIAGTVSTASTPSLRFNNDTGNNYSQTSLWGDGSTANSARESNVSGARIGYMGTGQSNTIVQIMNYSNTTTNKTILSRGNNTAVLTNARVALWRSTSAISEIDVTIDGTITFGSGSTFTLYGIKAE